MSEDKRKHPPEAEKGKAPKAEQEHHMPPSEGEQVSDGGTAESSIAQSAIFTLAQQLLSEAEKLAENIKEDARQEAEADAAKIRADVEAKARQEATDRAESEADAKSKKIVFNAEREAQRIVLTAETQAEEIVVAGRLKAEQLEADAESTVSDLRDRITGQIEAAVTKMDSLLKGSEERAEPELKAPWPHPNESIPQTANPTPRHQGYGEDGKSKLATTA